MAKQPRDWKRIRKWTFWITNVIGIIIAIPILVSVWPLLKVYWTTRSEAAVEANESFQTNQSLTLPNSSSPTPAQPHSSSPNFQALEEQLDHIEDLDPASIEAIVADHFGPAPVSDADPSVFDEESAVFEDINKVIREIEGQKYHIYVLELKDRNGNQSTRLAAYKKPNVDYERSMQTMKLVNQNSQLKSIYNAFSHVLAGMAEEQEAPPIEEGNEEVEIELVPPGGVSQ